ncbi:hypothetical protein H6F43_21170 [Leptolyngbya sp. FACHB-36]|uniref:hypothetical protein n=1 Tax=Leptolyngbya sp. FACHB-36 TaxID=2692808 RepID=UPI0016801ED7|nr:hypothetical protein [Leptolyngbya sp. FACHB-36]MBD2022697.1 hypothetical protein [Leptolyngbya sp. FACHB-36]
MELAVTQLAQQLQAQLRSWQPPIPFQVQCVLKSEALLVLIQHPLQHSPNPQAVFAEVEQAIQSPTFYPSAPIPSLVKLFLRRLGQKQPYAVYRFTVLPVSPPIVEKSRELSGEIVLHSPEPVETPFSEREFASRSLPWTAIAAVGVSVVAFFSGMLAVSSPCVLGRCEVLQAAEVQVQQSSQQLQRASTRQELQQVQQQMIEAQRSLRSVPFWSSRHGDAQSLLHATQPYSDALDQIFAAEATADRAVQASEKLPLSIAQWQGVQSTWREATVQLDAIPQSSLLYAYAQQRVVAYRANLNAVGQRIVQEQQTQKALTTAKATASLAEARQSVAQSLESWQLARSTWQVAVNTLQKIPDSTTNYSEAQQLLEQYVPKLTIARDRAAQEQLANSAYEQAMTLGQRAQVWEQQNQWSRAVVTWRNALTSAKRVPAGTFFQGQVQPLVTAYTSALRLAETKLQDTTAQQTLLADLNKICAGSPKLCTYTIAADLIRLQLTPTYEQAVQSAYLAGQAGDSGTLGGTVNHLESLQSALQAISTNAALPLEVYNSGGDLIGAFNPNRNESQ